MRIAIYSRKSVETNKGDSIKNQIDICKDYFQRREDNTEFEIFEDEGFTGANTNRPSFKIMMSKIKNKQFDAVAVYKVDRIARNTVDFVNIYDELEKLDVLLISVTEGFDASTPIGKMTMMLLASFAEMERMNIAQRVKDNMRGLAKNGKWTGGVVPFGYKTEKFVEGSKRATYLKLDESKVDIVKNIFSYYLEAGSMHQVQKWLYGNDIKWSLSTVKNILTSPVYTKANSEIINYLRNFGEVFGEADNIHGLITYNRRPYTNGKHRWNDKSMFYAISRHEGIIDADKWLKVQYMQNKNKVAPRPKNSQVSYLTGILKCAKCGSQMTVSYNHKNADGNITYVYVCTGRKAYGSDFCNASQVKQSDYDIKFLEKLDSYAKLDFEEFKRVLGKNKNINNTLKDIKKTEKKLYNNNQRIGNLREQSEVLSLAAAKPYLARVEELTSENEKLLQELFLLKQEEINNTDLPLEFIYDRLNEFMSTFNNLDINDKRSLLKKFISEIRFNSDTKLSEIDFL